MKEIDNAKRDGDYGVITHIGESCITCLSTGCKFGLLVLYYSRKKRKKPFFCNLKEEITLKEFIMRFPEYEWFIEDVAEDYKVINYLNYLPLEFPSRRHPLYVCGEKEGKIECGKVNLQSTQVYWI